MKKFLILVVTLVGLAFQGSFVSAQGTPAPAPTTPAAADQRQTTGGQESPTFRAPSEFGYDSPVDMVSVPDFIGRLISFALGIVGAIFLVMLIYGGFQWMTAGSQFAANGTTPGKSASQVSAAKTTLKNAVIGMIIVGLSYTIVTSIFTLGNSVLRDAPTTEADDDTPDDSADAGCLRGERYVNDRWIVDPTCP